MRLQATTQALSAGLGRALTGAGLIAVVCLGILACGQSDTDDDTPAAAPTQAPPPPIGSPSAPGSTNDARANHTATLMLKWRYSRGRRIGSRRGADLGRVLRPIHGIMVARCPGLRGQTQSQRNSAPRRTSCRCRRSIRLQLHRVRGDIQPGVRVVVEGCADVSREGRPHSNPASRRTRARCRGLRRRGDHRQCRGL